MKKIDFVELQGESGILGFSWLGDLSLQGIVSPSTDMDGLRLICGNILIGNKDTLSGFFRERRFNNYLVGKIHVFGNELIPNSRRDDFEDSVVKDELYSTFIREIGIPFSRKIRYLSTERGKVKSSMNLETVLQNAARVISHISFLLSGVFYTLLLQDSLALCSGSVGGNSSSSTTQRRSSS